MSNPVEVKFNLPQDQDKAIAYLTKLVVALASPDYVGHEPVIIILD